jgi:hypothetical protein
MGETIIFEKVTSLNVSSSDGYYTVSGIESATNLSKFITGYKDGTTGQDCKIMVRTAMMFPSIYVFKASKNSSYGGDNLSCTLSQREN